MARSEYLPCAICTKPVHYTLLDGWSVPLCSRHRYQYYRRFDRQQEEYVHHTDRVFVEKHPLIILLKRIFREYPTFL